MSNSGHHASRKMEKLEKVHRTTKTIKSLENITCKGRLNGKEKTEGGHDDSFQVSKMVLQRGGRKNPLLDL